MSTGPKKSKQNTRDVVETAIELAKGPRRESWEKIINKRRGGILQWDDFSVATPDTIDDKESSCKE